MKRKFKNRHLKNIKVVSTMSKLMDWKFIAPGYRFGRRLERNPFVIIKIENYNLRDLWIFWTIQ